MLKCWFNQSSITTFLSKGLSAHLLAGTFGAEKCFVALKSCSILEGAILCPVRLTIQSNLQGSFT